MILVVQFREDVTELHEQQCITKRAPEGAEVTFCSIFDQHVPFHEPEKLLAGVDKLILGGSAALSLAAGHDNNDYEKIVHILETVQPLLDYILLEDFPTLGLCFGHHLLAQTAGSFIACDANEAETGIFNLTLTDDGQQDPLMRNIPRTFQAIEGHQDSVASVPAGATLLVSGNPCKIQLLRYGKRAYGSQFHAELDHADLLYRMSLFPQYAAAASSESLAEVPLPHAPQVLRSFLAL